MSEHKATIRWTHTAGDFLKGRYSREHTWTLTAGLTVAASASPLNVPRPYSNEASVDPRTNGPATIAPSCSSARTNWCGRSVQSCCAGHEPALVLQDHARSG